MIKKKTAIVACLFVLCSFPSFFPSNLHRGPGPVGTAPPLLPANWCSAEEDQQSNPDSPLKLWHLFQWRQLWKSLCYFQKKKHLWTYNTVLLVLYSVFDLTSTHQHSSSVQFLFGVAPFIFPKQGTIILLYHSTWILCYFPFFPCKPGW